MQQTFPLAKLGGKSLMFVHRRSVCRVFTRTAGCSGKEAPMELKMRLNVLAAIMSFGFLAAVVFGMI